MNAKPLYLGCNASKQEIIKYGSLEQIREVLEQIREVLEREACLVEEKEKELEQTEKRLELIEEQLYFAQELIASIEAIMKTETRAKDLKKAIESAIENSYLER